MRRRIANVVGTVFLLAVVGSIGGGPALALSADAQKIVDAVKAANPVLHPICSDRGKLKTAVTEATTSLAKAKEFAGSPQAAGQEAGRYLYTNCPPA